MRPLVGRDDELAQIHEALATARSRSVATGLRITGDPGSGKTAVFERLTEEAAAAGWLVAAVECHRIQSGLPFVTARRIAQALLSALGPQRERYAGPLDAALENAGAVGEALFRLMEGILLDFPALVAVDDAQWIDADSREVVDQLMRTFSDRALAVMTTERSEDAARSGFTSISEGLALPRLSARAAADLARAHYPNASTEVVDAIVQHAAGHPIDIVAVAEAARLAGAADASAIEASVRGVVARQLHGASPQVREFLQMCALIPEPIEYRMLRRIWPDEATLTGLIEGTSGRYLVQEGASLRFAHSVVADSVRQTMPVEIPYRRRILAALTAMERLTLEDYERVVQQAHAIGDFDLEYDYLLKLAAEAATQSAASAATGAYERALAIMTPAPERAVAFYMQYALLLNAQDRMAEAKVLLEDALIAATKAGMSEGTGPLAALLVADTWRTAGISAALRTYRHYLNTLTTTVDRMHLQSMGAWLYSVDVDLPNFEAARADLIEHYDELPVEARMRLHATTAVLRARLGEYGQAVEAFDEALAAAATIRSAHRMVPEIIRVFVDFQQFGPTFAESRISDVFRRNLRDSGNALVEYVWALAQTARGSFEEAETRIREVLARGTDSGIRRYLLSVSAAIAALTKQPSPHAAAIALELHGFGGGEQFDTVVPLAAWWAAYRALENPDEGRKLLRNVVARAARPMDPTSLLSPVSLVLAAQRCNDTETLRVLSKMEGIWEDRTRWDSAQRQLTMGMARASLKESGAREVLLDAAQRFDELGAPLFWALAHQHADSKNEAAGTLLARLGIATPAGRVGKRKTSNGEQLHGSLAPTMRERQIAGLVSKGRTNREIAEELFLSERTIEAHLSNIFNKLGVSSRTQLTAWYLTSHPLAT